MTKNTDFPRVITVKPVEELLVGAGPFLVPHSFGPLFCTSIFMLFAIVIRCFLR